MAPCGKKLCDGLRPSNNFYCRNKPGHGMKKIVIFYTEILTGKVVLWCIFLSETSEKIHNFLISV